MIYFLKAKAFSTYIWRFEQNKAPLNVKTKLYVNDLGNYDSNTKKQKTKILSSVLNGSYILLKHYLYFKLIAFQILIIVFFSDKKRDHWLHLAPSHNL